MLFNSYEFILVFVPVVWLLYYLTRSLAGFRPAAAILVLASLFFYAYWYPPYIVIILASIGVNFAFGRLISRQDIERSRRKLLLVLGVSFNLALLFYYKYFGFLAGEYASVFWNESLDFTILLPIGISFYTFQQIAFLADSYKQSTRHYDFISYCLFVTFFPQLIAGPIVHHSEMMPQFREARARRVNPGDVATGLTIFAIGLFKKVMIADSLSLYASPVFAAADSGVSVTMMEAWLGTLAYSLQLYFDFSGYSDMAIGLAKMFGITLPFNFNSPYKATSITEFWRRWHMTLSRFLRDYLYVPLGGNRKGEGRRYANLMITMLLGGIWHGAGWGFAIWGLLHGLYLACNHLFQKLCAQRPGLARLMPGPLAWGITFLAVVLAWVPFRATTLDGALGLWSSMFAMNDIGIPRLAIAMLGLQENLGPLAAFLTGGENVIEFQDWARTGIPLIALSAIVALFAPNSQTLVGLVAPANRLDRTIAFAPSRRWAALTAVLLLVCLNSMNSVTEFMYFQF